MRIEDGWHLVCPDCRKIDDEGWEEEWSMYELDEITIETTEEGDPLINYKKVEEEAGEHIRTIHKCGFESEEWRAVDFGLLIKGGKVVDVGNYWRYNLDELKEILEELGVEMDVQKEEVKG